MIGIMIAAITLGSGGEVATIAVAVTIVCGGAYRVLRSRAREIGADARRAKATEDFVWGTPADPPYSPAIPGAAEIMLQLQQNYKEIEALMQARLEWEERHDKKQGSAT